MFDENGSCDQRNERNGDRVGALATHDRDGDIRKIV